MSDARLEALARFIAEYEKEHGEITAEQMRRAVRNARARAIRPRPARSEKRARK